MRILTITYETTTPGGLTTIKKLNARDDIRTASTREEQRAIVTAWEAQAEKEGMTIRYMNIHTDGSWQITRTEYQQGYNLKAKNRSGRRTITITSTPIEALKEAKEPKPRARAQRPRKATTAKYKAPFMPPAPLCDDWQKLPAPWWTRA